MAVVKYCVKREKVWKLRHLRGVFVDDRERAWAGLVVGRGLVLEPHKPRDRRRRHRRRGHRRRGHRRRKHRRCKHRRRGHRRRRLWHLLEPDLAWGEAESLHTIGTNPFPGSEILKAVGRIGLANDTIPNGGCEVLCEERKQCGNLGTYVMPSLMIESALGLALWSVVAWFLRRTSRGTGEFVVGSSSRKPASAS